jgi:hypothetical protein
MVSPVMVLMQFEASFGEIEGNNRELKELSQILKMMVFDVLLV